ELALLDELSDRDRGEELRDGAEPRERAERERPVRARVLASESARIDDLAPVDEHDRETRDALRIQLSLDRRIERPRDRLVSIDRPEASLGALVGASDGGGDEPGAQTEEDSETCSNASQGGDIRSSASRARPSYESFKHGKLSPDHVEDRLPIGDGKGPVLRVADFGCRIDSEEVVHRRREIPGRHWIEKRIRAFAVGLPVDVTAFDAATREKHA